MEVVLLQVAANGRWCWGPAVLVRWEVDRSQGGVAVRPRSGRTVYWRAGVLVGACSVKAEVALLPLHTHCASCLPSYPLPTYYLPLHGLYPCYMVCTLDRLSPD